MVTTSETRLDRVQLSATSYTPGGYKDPWLDWLKGLPANCLGGYKPGYKLGSVCNWREWLIIMWLRVEYIIVGISIKYPHQIKDPSITNPRVHAHRN